MYVWIILIYVQVIHSQAYRTRCIEIWYVPHGNPIIIIIKDTLK